MLRTEYKGKEVIIRIKRNLMLYSLNEEAIYQCITNMLDSIYNLETFAIALKECWVVGETQHSDFPLITVQNIVPVKNVINT